MSRVKLITESISGVKYIEEGEGSKKELYIEGIFSTADIENANGRKYKEKTLKRCLENLQESIKNNRLYGELNHPQECQVNPERAAILIKELKWDNGNIKGKAKVLTTPLGNIVRALIEAGGAIGISSRGTGYVDEDGYVNDSSYNLITWDVVGNPSNGPSWMKGIYEGKEWEVDDSGKILSEHIIHQKEEKLDESNSNSLLDKLSKLVIENKISEDTISEKIKEIVTEQNKEQIKNISESFSKILGNNVPNSEDFKKLVKEAMHEFIEEVKDLETKKNEDCNKKEEKNKSEDDEKKDEGKETEIDEAKKSEAKKVFVEYMLNIAKTSLKR